MSRDGKGQRAPGALDVMVEVQSPSDWRTKAEEHRMMARAAIRVALRHGIGDREIEAEYAKVCAEELAQRASGTDAAQSSEGQVGGSVT